MERAVATFDPTIGHQARREAMARLLAAEIMGLRNDPLGQNLPAECWSQVVKKADAALLLFTHTEASKRDVAAINP